MGGGQVRSGGPNIEILDGEVLHGAIGAPQSINGHGVLPISTAGAICRVFDNAVGAAVHDNVAATLDINRA